MGSMVGYMSIPGVTRGATAVTQYRAVIWDSTERRILPVTNANASRPIGVLQDDPDATGAPADVAYFGVIKAEAGAAVTFGDTLALDNSGRVVTDAELTDGSASDLHHIGDALEAASGAGAIIDIMLHTADRIGSE
jgi:hypothetical protein